MNRRMLLVSGKQDIKRTIPLLIVIIFTLLAAVQKPYSFNRTLYVAFIDFEMAFDSISRKLFWPILLKNGVTGKFFRPVY